VLLLARHSGDWWQRLSAGAGAVRDAVARASQEHMLLAGDLEPGLPAEDVVRQAIPFFAARLAVPAPDADRVTLTAGRDPRVLDLHAAALVAVLQSAGQSTRTALPVNTEMVLETLLGHEKHYWRGRADAAGLLSGPGGLSMEQLCQVAAAGCLLGASTAGELTGRVPGVEVTEVVALWLRELYPPDRDGMPGRPRPDRLAELHVTRELAAAPELSQACLTRLGGAQARRALILLARASAEHPAARTLLEEALSLFPDVVAGLAEPREVMIAVANAIPYPSLTLASAHIAVARRILATYAPEEPGRALWLNTLGVLLGDLRRPDEALAAIEEAVIIRRSLAEARPGAFLPDLATSLNNLSIHLTHAGRRADALAAIEEAVIIRRSLAESRPDAFLPDLATSLTNQSSCLSGLGRRADALAVIEGAVTAYRMLAGTRPGAFLASLATSLNNKSVCLLELRRYAEALAPIEEAVSIRRSLAESRPDAFLPDLATSLSNQSSCLSYLGRRQEALASLEGTIAARRSLARAQPGTFLPDLAASLTCQSVWLSHLGRREEALAAVEEAVTIRRALAGAEPGTFLPDLAISLTNQSIFLADLGRREEALTAIEETVTTYSTLADTWPEAFDNRHAMSLGIQATILSAQGHRDEAEAIRRKAAAIRRKR
jgi:tetratricopeptide (TPR) repeat protein